MLSHDFRTRTGTTTTFRMMLAETQQDVDDWSAVGILGVEMEGAMTFALSKHFEVPSTALFFVEDNMIENETMVSEAHASQGSIRSRSRAHQHDVGVALLLGSDPTPGV